ncbi:MAG TPA: thiamine pyrophosphate-dependent dehydrogenase E1 component subunit alpha [Acidimicrobiia bacterium]|jgi:TPP-dependent pyruvate/acetoin dehydrogenase alpha subunit|nr:thiamine pyrophosphate-dependent dehydrogenase E1 component subunit alpha [Acidimicrobiia bacterium]
MDIPKEHLVDMYETMVKIRRFEERIRELYFADKLPAFDIAAGLIPGEMHLAAGQEPVAVGMRPHLKAGDAITATHRPHHLAIAQGVDLNKMAAEIFGRETGLGRGKGGHMHLFSVEPNFGCAGIIGEGIPVAVGAAMAFRHRKTDNVALSYFGEGAANQGAFHESLNLAALWKLPVVFVCEDNSYAISVPKTASTAIADNSDRASAYGIPGALVANNDPVAVYEAMGEAIARARRGDGPSLIEIKTDRLWGHFEGDADAYRSDEFKTAMNEHDPLATFGKRLLDEAILNESDIASIQDAMHAEVEAALEFAMNSPYPAPESALEHVFAGRSE